MWTPMKQEIQTPTDTHTYMHTYHSLFLNLTQSEGQGTDAVVSGATLSMD